MPPELCRRPFLFMGLANMPFEAVTILEAQATSLTFTLQSLLGCLPHFRERLSAGSITIICVGT